MWYAVDSGEGGIMLAMDAGEPFRLASFVVVAAGMVVLIATTGASLTAELWEMMVMLGASYVEAGEDRMLMSTLYTNAWLSFEEFGELRSEEGMMHGAELRPHIITSSTTRLSVQWRFV